MAKRWFLFLFVFVSLAALVSGCGGGEKERTPAATSTPAAAVTGTPAATPTPSGLAFTYGVVRVLTSETPAKAVIEIKDGEGNILYTVEIPAE